MWNLKALLGIKSAGRKDSLPDTDFKYDENVGFYYTNLINSIILFALTREELDKLAGPVFNPMSELESEIDSAFTPVLFETIFRNGLIDNALRAELLNFKQETDSIPPEIWDWDYLDKDPTWIHVRQQANKLLDKLGVKSKTYNDDYITVYVDGKMIKKGKTYQSK